MFKRRNKKKASAEQLKFLNNFRGLSSHSSKNSHDGEEDLSSFDACITTSDSLAASPNTQEFKDCSILVSPDGVILGESLKDSSNHSSTSSVGDSLSLESAIYIGHDLSVDGEMQLNGFSTRGLNPFMSTMALRKAVDTVESTGHFVEDLILARKNAAASESQACEKLRNMMHISPDDSSISSQNIHTDNGILPQPSFDAIPSSPSNQALTPGQKSSAGPLLFPGSSLQSALIALDKYHSTAAELDAERWRKATRAQQEDHTIGVLPQIYKSVQKTQSRIERREKAIRNSQESQSEAESYLRSKKDKSKKLWTKIEDIEKEINTKVAEFVRQRNRERELKRKKEAEDREQAASNAKLTSTVTNQEIWELVSKIGTDGEDFAPSGLPTPSFFGPLDQAIGNPSSFDSQMSSSAQPIEMEEDIDNYRITLEMEYGLDALQKAALECDEQIQDAAGSLLNVYSNADTTKRSAKVAAETGLLSAANAQVDSLKALIKLEKESIQERLALITELEKKVNEVDVRKDLNKFIQHEKTQLPNGTSKLSDNDDGGVASALAVLNSHSEGIGIGIGVAGMAELSSFTGWDDKEEGEVFDREELEEAVGLMFSANLSDPQEKKDFDDSIDLLIKAVSEKSVKARGYRASTCYAMNNHRGKVSQIHEREQFDGLCKVLNALLDGCDRESADVASAKMVMMLAQTFYCVQEEGEDKDDRSKRIYPKDHLCSHPIWLDEDFWTQALFQCVTDSLSNSGVVMRVKVKKSSAPKGNKMKWHDLKPMDRVDAAAQVHAVIFAQLGALAHSMVEFGCEVDKACHFVRRLSVRHQLPLSQRAMLLAHLREKMNLGESMKVEMETKTDSKKLKSESYEDYNGKSEI